MKIGWGEVVNIIIIFQLLIFTAFLFLKKPHFLSNYILGIHLFSQAAGIFCGLQYMQQDYFFINHPFTALAGFPFVFLWGPTYYFYVKSLTFRDFKFKPAHLWHLIPFITAVLFFSYTLYFHDNETKRSVLNNPNYFLSLNHLAIDITLRLQILVYIILSVIMLGSIKEEYKENFSSPSSINFPWLNFVVFGYTTCYLISVLLLYSYYFSNANNSFLLMINYLQFFIYFNIIFYKAWDQPEIFRKSVEKLKYKSSQLNEQEVKCWLEKLNIYMRDFKPYLNPEITLNELAEKININRRVLSQLINQYYRQNFYDYINQLRIERSKTMLADPLSGKNILETLYETGFNSKATFNRVFKKNTGLSPKDYRKKFCNRI